MTLADAGGESTSYSYTKRGELAQAQNPTGTVKLTYDDAGRMIQETVNGQTVDLKFNQENERVQLSALGIQTNYTYDSIGRLTGITTGQKQYDFAYDILGRRTSLALPNNSTTGYTYDNASQLTGISHSGAFNASYSYSFDNVGRIVKWSGDGSDWNYQYDQLGRLTNAGHGSDVFDYDYDELGNMQGNGSQYDIANRLTQDADYNYTYDLNGNLKQKQDKSSGAKTVYTWNKLNQLVKVERYADSSAATPTKVLSFTYDPLGRRWSKTEDGNAEKYVYDGYNLIGVLDSSNNLVRSFTFGTGIDEPLGLTTSGAAYYYHANHQGSIMGLTNESGTVASAYSYSPYGETAITGNASINPFQYTGREFDADDLYYYRARYYQPSLGRFMSEDPIGLRGGDFNLYRYVQNNPVNLVDPEGLWALQLAGTLLGAGANAYVNYSAYESGRISGLEYTQSIIFGAGLGLLSSFAPGIVGGSIVGGTTSAINNTYNQALTNTCGNINWKDVRTSFIAGGFSGLLGGLGAKIGGYIMPKFNVIGQTVGAKLPNYGATGGIIGTTVGTVITLD